MSADINKLYCGMRIWDCGIRLTASFLSHGEKFPVADGKAILIFKKSFSTGMFEKTIFLLIIMLLLTGCDYGRFKDQEALRAYKVEMPQMVEGTIPIKDSIQILRMTKPNDLHNPLPLTRESVDMGRERYGYFCIMCHGPKADGDGTVGQSFSPLPTNLTSPYVQKQSDGELFYKIYFGFRRHPALIYTVADNDRWLIINYIRSLGKK
jgi:hypothetical protein